MKSIRVIYLSLLVLCYGMPLPVLAQATTETFSLPDVRVGEVYRINIASVLRDKYRLGLETEARSTFFRWAFSVGGYAGKQQKLAGNLFEGLALPEGVDEIPVEKNYRWSAGFALSYRIK